MAIGSATLSNLLGSHRLCGCADCAGGGGGLTAPLVLVRLYLAWSAVVEKSNDDERGSCLCASVVGEGLHKA
jgi:hypothetical protein